MSTSTEPLDLLVLGPRTHSQALVDSFECLARKFRFVGYVENMDQSKAGSELGGLPIHWHEDIADWSCSHGMVCGLATTLRRQWIEASELAGFGFPSLLHPGSVISSRSPVGHGVIVDAGCVVAGYTRLADHCRVGRACSIGHHTEIGRFATLHPGVIVSGNCRIGEQALIGTGAIITDGVKIGDGAVIAPGSVVRHDVAQRALVAMPSAKTMRQEFGPR